MGFVWKGVVLAVLVHFVASQECDTDNGWQELNGRCFRVSRSAPETQYTWQEAREVCLSEGGDLASLHSLEEQNFVITLALQVGLLGSDLWIGMNQLEAKSGPFEWSDESTVDYTYWALNQPLTSGLTFCSYTATEDGPGPFQRYTGYSTIYGLLTPGYDYPWDADEVYTFYFGGGYEYDQNWCESRCEANPRCAGYSWYWYHWDYNWQYQCVGRTDDFNILEYDSYCDSGVRSLSGGNYGWWYSTNCGLNKALACSKDVGSDTPITLPPPIYTSSFCPSGYFSADGNKGTSNKCFKIVEVPTDTAGFRWDQALLLCRNEPGLNPDLAAINTAEENAIITAQLRNRGWGFWFGLHYATNHAAWVWSDNSEPNFYNWGPGEPESVGDQCAELWTSPGPVGTWNDLVCDSGRGYICQTYKDPQNTIPTGPPTTPTTCPEGWTPYWYACYQEQSTPATWSAANDQCRSIGGSLATIHSNVENSAVFFAASSNLELPIWIGLSKDAESGAYVWEDGWPFSFDNFDVNGTIGGGGCVHMQSNEKWQDTDCEATKPYICKQTDAPTPTIPQAGEGFCPRGAWIPWGAHCYWFSTETDTFQNALVNCQIQAGSTEYTANLVSISSQLENEFIKNQLKSVSYSDGAWIGLTRVPGTIDQFRWTDGTEVTYYNWAPGEPSDPVNELCSEMWSTQFEGMWNDRQCESYDYNYYVCKSTLGPSPTYPNVPTPAPGECPTPEWQANGEDCFLFKMSYEDLRGWYDAVETCKIITGGRGTLATVNDQDENNFIYFYADFFCGSGCYYNIWIGLYKQGYGYPYVWEDGSEATYRNWVPGEPNDVDGSNNCVRMYIPGTLPLASAWDDYSCGVNYENGYVCRTSQGYYGDLDQKAIEAELARKNLGKRDQKKEVLEYKKKYPLKTQPHAKPDLFAEEPVDVIDLNEADIEKEIFAADNSPPSKHTNQTVGIILGVAIGLVAIMAVVFVVIVRKRRTKRQPALAFVNPASEDADTKF